MLRRQFAQGAIPQYNYVSNPCVIRWRMSMSSLFLARAGLYLFVHIRISLSRQGISLMDSSSENNLPMSAIIVVLVGTTAL